MRTNLAYVFLDLPSRIEIEDNFVTLFISVPDGNIDAPLRRFRDYAGTLTYCYSYSIDRILTISFKITDAIAGITLRRPTLKNGKHVYANLNPRTPQALVKEK